MKLIIIVAAIVALAVAAPAVEILKYENDNIGVGDYKFVYELSDGTAREETAELKNAGTDQESLVVRGSFTWVDATGQKYTVTYVADENGFQPTGKHLPTV